MKGKKRLERLEPRLSKLYRLLCNAREVFTTDTPSVRELVREMGEDPRIHTSRVHGDLEKLVKLGLAERLPIPTRQFKAVGPPPDEVSWEELLL